jgi:predicted nuclease of predicted toxin-antitoxin system
MLSFLARFFSSTHPGPLSEMLSERELGKSDFNDQVIARLCQKNGFILVTHDADFQSSELDILTANPSMLRNKKEVGDVPVASRWERSGWFP